MFTICFTDQCLARLKQSFSLFPPRKLLIWAVNSLITQSHYSISNDVKVKCRSLSRKFLGEMTLFASAFPKPMKILARLFLFDKPIECFTFLFTLCFKVIRNWLYYAKLTLQFLWRANLALHQRKEGGVLRITLNTSKGNKEQCS